MSKVSVIIVAAGKGRRFQAVKQFAVLKNKSVLEWSLDKFEKHPQVDEIILVWRKEWEGQVSLGPYTKLSEAIQGGEWRQDSVREGFGRLRSRAQDIVLVHDGSRPLVSDDLITRVIEGVRREESAVPVVPVEETLKKIRSGYVMRTVERRELYRTQTPQGFTFSLLKKALEKAALDSYLGTDESSLVERLGQKVKGVRGDPQNIKITFPQDVVIAEALIES
ncbi:2-C-methyl-D-erythritol 4-phosphate cytidylyltransferase [bacterium]|nr:2-C-methyl-D-erythritol 4-phosphate cytidylyltransferase [bacterium]